MKSLLRHLYIILILLLPAAGSAQYIQVDDTYTAQQLVNALLSGSCAQVSNVSVNGWSGSSGGPSFGYFTAAGSGFPFADGIVLSTGFAASAPGPNNSLLSEGSVTWPGDSDLENALGVGSTINATILEFDFIPYTNKISFDYIFASEQYLTSINSPNQCNYTDGFAFLLKEVNNTQPYQNLALVPGTNIPVRVNTVRGPGVCPAANQQYFGGFNPGNSPINFNGQTVILKAEADVTAGTLYHIKLVVADQGNNLYDSAIFLGGGSFTATTDLGPDRLIATDNPVCDGETVQLDAFEQGATNYRWYRNGNLEYSGPNSVFTVTQPGTYTSESEFTPTCASTGSIVIEYIQMPAAGNYTLLQCDENNDGLTLYNLTLANTLVNTDPNNWVSYHTTFNNADTGDGAIVNTQAFANTTPNQLIYARVESRYGCHTVSNLTLSTSANSITDPDPLAFCDDADGNEEGIRTFDLTAAGQQILQALPPNLQLQYFASLQDALSVTDPIQNPQAYTNTVPNAQTVYARIASGSDCYGIAEIKLIAYTFGSLLADETLILCTDATIQLNAGSGFTNYTWNTQPPVNRQVLTVDEPGIYTVTITNTNGCVGTKTFTVQGSGPATGAVINITDFAGDNNAITITPQGAGNYEYSVDGSTYQPEPVFTGLPSGQYTVYIKDINGCNPVFEKVVYVMDYPRFFTPNGDGTNDVWRIPFLNFKPGAVVTIFDRFGKIVASFKGSSYGWDGTLNGAKLPSTDYWFIVNLQDGRIIKGHFSMLR